MKITKHPYLILLGLTFLVCGCVSNKPKNDWVTDSSKDYPPSTWITAIGAGNSSQDAIDQALSNLSRIFNTEIYSERISNSVFNEYLDRNTRSFEESSNYEQNTRIRSSLRMLNTRILAQKSTQDGKYYALAGLNKLESEQVYTSEMEKIASVINDDMKAFEVQTNSFDKLRIWKKMDREIGLLESFDSQLQIISKNGSIYEYQHLSKSVDDIGRKLRPQMVLHIQSNVASTVKDEIINLYEKIGFTYNPNAENPMLKLDVTFQESKALVERIDAVFFNWNLSIRHLDPFDNNRLKTFNIRDRSGSTNEVNAKARLEMDIKRRLNEKLPSFIETQLLELSEFSN